MWRRESKKRGGGRGKREVKERVRNKEEEEEKVEAREKEERKIWRRGW